ncbi:MAG: hypothetical protein AAGI34_09705 [Pseudomonadota bacterium]
MTDAKHPPAQTLPSTNATRFPPEIADAVVTELYRSLLGRDPDQGGKSRKVSRLIETGDIADVLNEIVQSQEYVRRQFNSVWKKRTLYIDLSGIENVTRENLQALFDKTSRYWREAG